MTYLVGSVHSRVHEEDLVDRLGSQLEDMLVVFEFGPHICQQCAGCALLLGPLRCCLIRQHASAAAPELRLCQYACAHKADTGDAPGSYVLLRDVLPNTVLSVL